MTQQQLALSIIGGLIAFGALSLLPWRCTFSQWINPVGDLPARCSVNTSITP